MLKNVNATVSLMSNVGFIINHQKSMFSPCKKIPYLGYIDRKRLLTHVTICRAKFGRQYGKAQDIGMLVASFSAVELAEMHYRQLKKSTTEALKKHKGNYNASMYINHSMKHELNWWIDNICIQYGTICRPSPTKVLETDPSLQGWGAKLADRESRVFSDNSEWELDVNIFKHICNTWGIPDIDLFASRMNA
ncbi:hypothetical protein MAR_037005 [Mya arenaria]|uniref:Uncharacterized protein n=1 Tax=Mya arenaria TaxID=6604 RepID=A0ABY7FVY1_MYAAR|nr:hypothetical protein MAR_037005 [Mya arenaria]